jgi:hypothetical protein
MKKVKIGISTDELYPFYSICLPKKDGFTSILKVDPKTLKQWKKVMSDFTKVQQEISDCEEEP